MTERREHFAAFPVSFLCPLLSVRSVRNAVSHIDSRPVIAGAPMPAGTVVPSTTIPMSVAIIAAITIPIVVAVIECGAYGDASNERNTD